MTALPEAELSFYYAALAQLAPAMREVFTERVARILGAHPDPGPGDVDRAVRSALVGLWTPPVGEEMQRVGRWNSAAPAFERVSRLSVQEYPLRRGQLGPVIAALAYNPQAVGALTRSEHRFVSPSIVWEFRAA